MENEGKKPEAGPQKSSSLKTSEAFLKATLFLLFGPKKWQEGKRPVPPIYIVGGIILFLIFILIFKKITTKPARPYPSRPYPQETMPPGPYRPQLPPADRGY